MASEQVSPTLFPTEKEEISASRLEFNIKENKERMWQFYNQICIIICKLLASPER